MRNVIFPTAFCAALAGLGGFAAAQTDDGIKVVIGNNLPLFTQCFENARDGETGFEALEPCDQSLQQENLSPRKTAIVHANRGVIYFNLGDFEAAVNDFSASLDLGIHLRAQLHANRGLAYEALRLDALARADYKAALAIKDTQPTALRRLEELSKPLYERSGVPRRITAEAPASNTYDR